MEKNLMMLVNPVAGRALTDAALGHAVNTFCTAGWHPTVMYTDAAGAARTMAAKYAPQYDHLVCLGGDGTLSDVISGLMTLPKEQRPRLGYIPMGTANDVANTLGIPMRQPARAAAQVLDGEPLPYDVGEMAGVGYFTYITAFGAFTEVSYKTDQELKHALGHAAYMLEAISALPSIKSCHAVVEHDDGSLEGDFIYGAVSNSLSVAGVMKMNPKLVDLSDGKFELLLVHKPRQTGDLNTVIGSLITQNYTSPCLTVLQSTRVKFHFEEPVAWTRDGEDGGAHTDLELICHPQAVEIWR